MSDFESEFNKFSQMFAPAQKMSQTIRENKSKLNKIDEAVSEFDNFVKNSGVDENDPIIKAARFEVSRNGSIKPQDLVKTMEYLRAQTPEQEAIMKAKASLIEQAIKSGIEYTGQEPSELAKQIRQADIRSKQEELMLSTEKEKMKSSAKSEAEMKEAKEIAQINESRMADAISSLGDHYESAFRAGLVGDAVKAKISASVAGMPDVIAKSVGIDRSSEAMAKRAALPGKLFEVAVTTMPTLTQQVGKEGSVS